MIHFILSFLAFDHLFQDFKNSRTADRSTTYFLANKICMYSSLKKSK